MPGAVHILSRLEPSSATPLLSPLLPITDDAEQEKNLQKWKKQNKKNKNSPTPRSTTGVRRPPVSNSTRSAEDSQGNRAGVKALLRVERTGGAWMSARSRGSCQRLCCLTTDLLPLSTFSVSVYAEREKCHRPLANVLPISTSPFCSPPFTDFLPMMMIRCVSALLFSDASSHAVPLNRSPPAELSCVAKILKMWVF